MSIPYALLVADYNPEHVKRDDGISYSLRYPQDKKWSGWKKSILNVLYIKDNKLDWYDEGQKDSSISSTYKEMINPKESSNPFIKVIHVFDTKEELNEFTKICKLKHPEYFI